MLENFFDGLKSFFSSEKTVLNKQEASNAPEVVRLNDVIIAINQNFISLFNKHIQQNFAVLTVGHLNDFCNAFLLYLETPPSADIEKLFEKDKEKGLLAAILSLPLLNTDERSEEEYYECVKLLHTLTEKQKERKSKNIFLKGRENASSIYKTALYLKKLLQWLDFRFAKVDVKDKPKQTLNPALAVYKKNFFELLHAELKKYARINNNIKAELKAEEVQSNNNGVTKEPSRQLSSTEIYAQINAQLTIYGKLLSSLSKDKDGKFKSNAEVYNAHLAFKDILSQFLALTNEHHAALEGLEARKNAYLASFDQYAANSSLKILQAIVKATSEILPFIDALIAYKVPGTNRKIKLSDYQSRAQDFIDNSTNEDFTPKPERKIGKPTDKDIAMESDKVKEQNARKAKAQKDSLNNASDNPHANNNNANDDSIVASKSQAVDSFLAQNLAFAKQGEDELIAELAAFESDENSDQEPEVYDPELEEQRELLRTLKGESSESTAAAPVSSRAPRKSAIFERVDIATLEQQELEKRKNQPSELNQLQNMLENVSSEVNLISDSDRDKCAFICKKFQILKENKKVWFHRLEEISINADQKTLGEKIGVTSKGSNVSKILLGNYQEILQWYREVFLALLQIESDEKIPNMLWSSNQMLIRAIDSYLPSLIKIKKPTTEDLKVLVFVANGVTHLANESYQAIFPGQQTVEPSVWSHQQAIDALSGFLKIDVQKNNESCIRATLFDEKTKNALGEITKRKDIQLAIALDEVKNILDKLMDKGSLKDLNMDREEAKNNLNAVHEKAEREKAEKALNTAYDELFDAVDLISERLIPQIDFIGNKLVSEDFVAADKQWTAFWGEFKNKIQSFNEIVEPAPVINAEKFRPILEYIAIFLGYLQQKQLTTQEFNDVFNGFNQWLDKKSFFPGLNDIKKNVLQFTYTEPKEEVVPKDLLHNVAAAVDACDILEVKCSVMRFFRYLESLTYADKIEQKILGVWSPIYQFEERQKTEQEKKTKICSLCDEFLSEQNVDDFEGYSDQLRNIMDSTKFIEVAKSPEAVRFDIEMMLADEKDPVRADFLRHLLSKMGSLSEDFLSKEKLLPSPECLAKFKEKVVEISFAREVTPTQCVKLAVREMLIYEKDTANIVFLNYLLSRMDAFRKISVGGDEFASSFSMHFSENLPKIDLLKWALLETQEDNKNKSADEFAPRFTNLKSYICESLKVSYTQLEKSKQEIIGEDKLGETGSGIASALRKLLVISNEKEASPIKVLRGVMIDIELSISHILNDRNKTLLEKINNTINALETCNSNQINPLMASIRIYCLDLIYSNQYLTQQVRLTPRKYFEQVRQERTILKTSAALPEPALKSKSEDKIPLLSSEASLDDSNAPVASSSQPLTVRAFKDSYQDVRITAFDLKNYNAVKKDIEVFAKSLDLATLAPAPDKFDKKRKPYDIPTVTKDAFIEEFKLLRSAVTDQAMDANNDIEYANSLLGLWHSCYEKLTQLSTQFKSANAKMDETSRDNWIQIFSQGNLLAEYGKQVYNYMRYVDETLRNQVRAQELDEQQKKKDEPILQKDKATADKFAKVLDGHIQPLVADIYANDFRYFHTQSLRSATVANSRGKITELGRELISIRSVVDEDEKTQMFDARKGHLCHVLSEIEKSVGVDKQNLYKVEATFLSLYSEINVYFLELKQLDIEEAKQKTGQLGKDVPLKGMNSLEMLRILPVTSRPSYKELNILLNKIWALQDKLQVVQGHEKSSKSVLYPSDTIYVAGKKGVDKFNDVNRLKVFESKLDKLNNNLDEILSPENIGAGAPEANPTLTNTNERLDKLERDCIELEGLQVINIPTVLPSTAQKVVSESLPVSDASGVISVNSSEEEIVNEEIVDSATIQIYKASSTYKKYVEEGLERPILDFETEVAFSINKSAKFLEPILRKIETTRKYIADIRHLHEEIVENTKISAEAQLQRALLALEEFYIRSSTAITFADQSIKIGEEKNLHRVDAGIEEDAASWHQYQSLMSLQKDMKEYLAALKQSVMSMYEFMSEHATEHSILKSFAQYDTDFEDLMNSLSALLGPKQTIVQDVANRFVRACHQQFDLEEIKGSLSNVDSLSERKLESLNLENVGEYLNELHIQRRKLLEFDLNQSVSVCEGKIVELNKQLSAINGRLKSISSSSADLSIDPTKLEQALSEQRTQVSGELDIRVQELQALKQEKENRAKFDNQHLAAYESAYRWLDENAAVDAASDSDAESDISNANDFDNQNNSNNATFDDRKLFAKRYEVLSWAYEKLEDKIKQVEDEKTRLSRDAEWHEAIKIVAGHHDKLKLAELQKQVDFAERLSFEDFRKYKFNGNDNDEVYITFDTEYTRFILANEGNLEATQDVVEGFPSSSEDSEPRLFFNTNNKSSQSHQLSRASSSKAFDWTTPQSSRRNTGASPLKLQAFDASKANQEVVVGEGNYEEYLQFMNFEIAELSRKQRLIEDPKNCEPEELAQYEKACDVVDDIDSTYEDQATLEQVQDEIKFKRKLNSRIQLLQAECEAKEEEFELEQEKDLPFKTMVSTLQNILATCKAKAKREIEIKKHVREQVHAMKTDILANLAKGSLDHQALQIQINQLLNLKDQQVTQAAVLAQAQVKEKTNFRAGKWTGGGLGLLITGGVWVTIALVSGPPGWIALGASIGLAVAIAGFMYDGSRKTPAAAAVPAMPSVDAVGASTAKIDGLIEQQRNNLAKQQQIIIDWHKQMCQMIAMYKQNIQQLEVEGSKGNKGINGELRVWLEVLVEEYEAQIKALYEELTTGSTVNISAAPTPISLQPVPSSSSVAEKDARPEGVVLDSEDRLDLDQFNFN